MKLVRPCSFHGWSMSIAQLWGSGPKYTIECGDCTGTFQRRIPVVDEPTVQCPYCKSLNKLPLTTGRPL